MNDQKRYSMTVTGKVQGVYFRASTRYKARELGLSGWVRNEEDGSVRIIAEGEENALLKLFDWAKNGSEAAEVTNVDYAISNAEGLKGFEIKR